MLRLVADAFNVGDHLMIEAPTGTGKSLAYLLPAGEWAVKNSERVVIATHTINLQDQLLSKDIPLLQDKLGMNVAAAALKGRSNYLCPRRLSTLRRRNPTSVDELRRAGENPGVADRRRQRTQGIDQPARRFRDGPCGSASLLRTKAVPWIAAARK